MFFKTVTLMLWMVAVCMGASLFWASGEVQKAEASHLVLSKEISKEQSRLHVLKAEWHYLNNPEYLEQMAARYLGVENQSDEERIVVAGDSLPRYVVPEIPSEKPESLLLAMVETRSMTDMQGNAEVSDKIPSPVKTAVISSDEKFGAVLANWSGGR